MHTELIKHNLKEDGEDNIYDTAGMAICLGVVQNYTFEQTTPKSRWKLKRKETPDEDALYGGFAGGGDEAASAQMVEGLLLTKKACMDFAEELQMEISEVMYARVHEATGDEIADDFCPQAVKPVKRERTQKYVPAASAAERQKQGDTSALMAESKHSKVSKNLACPKELLCVERICCGCASAVEPARSVGGGGRSRRTSTNPYTLSPTPTPAGIYHTSTRSRCPFHPSWRFVALAAAGPQVP